MRLRYQNNRVSLACVRKIARNSNEQGVSRLLKLTGGGGGAVIAFWFILEHLLQVSYFENIYNEGLRIHEITCYLGVVLMKLESFSFNIFQSSEVTHLISCQPTALKAVRLQSLVPPNPDKIYIRDLLVKNEVRIHLFFVEDAEFRVILNMNENIF